MLQCKTGQYTTVRYNTIQYTGYCTVKRRADARKRFEIIIIIIIIIIINYKWVYTR